MSGNGAVNHYLDLMDAQREAIFLRLASLDEPHLWQRPKPKTWSVGETLDHTRVLLRTFRRLLQILYPLLMPWGWLLRRRPYPTEMDNVYERPSFPNTVGWLFAPRYTPQRPASLAELSALVESEHDRVRAFYLSKDERVLGHVWLYDPAIGWINMIQALRIGVYHDQHHYDIIERRLDQREADSSMARK